MMQQFETEVIAVFRSQDGSDSAVGELSRYVVTTESTEEAERLALSRHMDESGPWGDRRLLCLVAHAHLSCRVILDPT